MLLLVRMQLLRIVSKVSPGAHLENVIIDKDARIEKKTELIGDAEPLYVKEGDVV